MWAFLFNKILRLSIRYFTIKNSIRCRITFNKLRKEFSTGLFINPKNWNSKQQLVKPPEPDSDFINSQLSLIKTKINRAFLLLQVKEEPFTVTDVFKSFKGEKIAKEYNTVEFFERYLKKLKKLVGIDLEEATYMKFGYVKTHVKNCIKWQYKTSDYPLKDLKLQFVNDFEYYLKTEKKQAQITVNKSMQRSRRPVKIAVAEGFLDKDPFMLYKTKSVRTEVVFLSVEELATLESHEFTQLYSVSKKQTFKGLNLRDRFNNF